jgi:hypothetical protein
MTAEEDLWPIVEHLARVPHVRIVPDAVARRLPRVDDRSYRSGILGAPGH